jgi:hypothetical protein
LRKTSTTARSIPALVRMASTSTGAERTYRGHRENGVHDPLQTSAATPTANIRTHLVWVRTFFFVLQQFPSHSIDADFLRHCAAFNVEGISQATATVFFFQFLVYDFAGMGFESYGPRLSDAIAGKVAASSPKDAAVESQNLIIFDMIGPRSWGCAASMSLTRFSGEGPSRLRSHFGANVKLW